jgi:hypothetical protein
MPATPVRRATRALLAPSLAALLAALLGALLGAPVGAQQSPANPAAAAADSTRRQLPMLGVLQGLQVVNVPELAAAVNALLSDTSSDTSAHMRAAPRRAATAADSARAADVVRRARAALAPYRDVAAAERDGYVRFLPWLEEQPIYHYNHVGNVLNHVGNVLGSFSAFDPTRPVSLLYRKDAGGTLALVGAMYSALPSATPDDLDARLPLGIAHWHEHVNFCAPPRDAVRVVGPAPRADGTTVGPSVDGASLARWLEITTREACAAAGGRFVPRLFGWMAHVYLFAGDDPAAIWGGDEHDHMRMHRKP